MVRAGLRVVVKEAGTPTLLRVGDNLNLHSIDYNTNEEIVTDLGWLAADGNNVLNGTLNNYMIT
jgi:hypothetical protein